jgi:hypothetical protein
MSELVSTVLFYAVIVLSGALGVHHFIKARRGLRTGVVEGLMIGYWGNRYEREYDPEAFWVNVWAGFFVATLGAVAVLWTILMTSLIIGDSYGYAAP